VQPERHTRKTESMPPYSIRAIGIGENCGELRGEIRSDVYQQSGPIREWLLAQKELAKLLLIRTERNLG
jgi:hypothetical protein